MKSYPKYKDSGVEQIGEIPEHWDAYPLKRVARMEYGEPLKDEDRRDGNVAVFGSNGIVGYHTESITRAPCIVVGRKGSFGKINFSTEPCYPIDTTFFLDERHTRHSVAWFRYIFPLLGWDESSHDSAVPGLSREVAYASSIPIAPLIEQNAITRFLDAKTRQIDELIEKKRRQIELLKEYRAAVISEAVTKGLNPNVRMKDSGVEWVGLIPEHWTVIQLKRLFRKTDYGISESLSGDGRYRVLTMGHIQDGEIVIPEHGAVEQVSQDLVLERDDLLFNRTNSPELVCKVGLFRGEKADNVTFASYLVRFKTAEVASPSFTNYLLNSSECIAAARSRALLSINQANMNPTKYGQLRVCIPPLSEQREIVVALDRHTATVASLVAILERQIEFLQSYRTSLISEAVTGKIDVRDWSPA